MNRHFLAIMAFITLLAYAWPAWQRLSADSHRGTLFQESAPVKSDAEAPSFFSREFIGPEKAGSIVHVGSISETHEQRLAAVWYGGTREGAKDVSIFFSEKTTGQNGSWSVPRIIVDRKSASFELKRFIKKVGNPVLWSDSTGKLWLVYVTISAGGWSGSSLNIKTSLDGGHTWSRSQRLTLSPFLNISELVKGRPVFLKTDGGKDDSSGFAVPIYHECLGYFPELLWIKPSNTGFQYTKSRMAANSGFLQPSIATQDALRACAFYRCLCENRRIAMATTKDAGKQWSSPAFLDLPNPDSAVSALSLSGGRILLAFNDSQSTRETLSLAVSQDQGLSWTRIHTLEQAPDEEFSYPYMIRGQNGRIHLVYTWKRKRIRHTVFNEAWINEQLDRTNNS